MWLQERRAKERYNRENKMTIYSCIRTMSSRWSQMGNLTSQWQRARVLEKPFWHVFRNHKCEYRRSFVGSTVPSAVLQIHHGPDVTPKRCHILPMNKRGSHPGGCEDFRRREDRESKVHMALQNWHNRTT